MDVAGLSQERGARSATTRRSASTRDGRPPRPAAGVARFEPARIASTDSPAPDAADQLQADYFIRMLAQRRRLIDQHIEEYQRAIATAEAKGDADAACGFRRLTRIEEHDRQTLDAMMDKLCRRFTRRAPRDVPAPRLRFPVRPVAPVAPGLV